MTWESMYEPCIEFTPSCSVLPLKTPECRVQFTNEHPCRVSRCRGVTPLGSHSLGRLVPRLRGVTSERCHACLGPHSPDSFFIQEVFDIFFFSPNPEYQHFDFQLSDKMLVDFREYQKDLKMGPKMVQNGPKSIPIISYGQFKLN